MKATVTEKEIIRELSERLWQASETRLPIAPLTDTEEGLTIDDAYAIQMEIVARRLAKKDSISGKKIGLTSEGIQKQMGVNEPDYGHLFASMDYSDTGTLPFAKFVYPKIEAEIAFCLKEDLTGGKVSADDVRRATAYVAPAFEIVDSRVADWKIKLIDTVSDNASSGAYVLGPARVDIKDLDLRKVRMRMYKDTELISEGTGAAVLGDPCISVAWLSNRLWDYGVTLKAGEIILSGAFTAAPPAAKGERFRADFDILGSVSANFV